MRKPNHLRLADVVIVRLAFADLVRRYGQPGTPFFIDPPYVGSEGRFKTL